MSIVHFCMGILVIFLISYKLYDKQKRRGKVVCVVEHNCAGCQRCVQKCSRHALEMVRSEIKICAVVKYSDRCTACGDCLGKCKFNALKLIERK